jgi:nitroreductase/NAD-dependent dihydropyrimidine dehydrogenase PreA subunit
MSLFTVSEECTRCGMCVAECPAMIVALPEDGSVAMPVLERQESCINCGHCVSVCPEGALSLATMAVEDCVPIKEELVASAQQVEQFLRSRRSIRSYKQETPAQADIEKMLKLASYAPSGSNSQMVGWLVINGRDKVKRMSGLAVDWMRSLLGTGHPLESYGIEGIVQAWDHADMDIICRGATALVLAHAPAEYPAGTHDCVIALAHADLAAPSVGLGTCWAGFLMMAAGQWAPLQEALGLPEDRALHGGLMVGYPTASYQRMPVRNAPAIEYL